MPPPFQLRWIGILGPPILIGETKMRSASLPRFDASYRIGMHNLYAGKIEAYEWVSSIGSERCFPIAPALPYCPSPKQMGGIPGGRQVIPIGIV